MTTDKQKQPTFNKKEIYIMSIITTKDGFIPTPNQTKDVEIKGKVIRKSNLARQILAKGQKDVWLFDIKPDRENPQRTVFLFEDTPKFQEIFSQVLKENEGRRNKTMKQENDSLRNELNELKGRFDELTNVMEKLKE